VNRTKKAALERLRRNRVIEGRHLAKNSTAQRCDRRYWHGGDRILEYFPSVAFIDLVSDTINRNYFCSELKVAVT
jgi:hypothetical protein